MALANSRGFSAGYDATQAWAYASAFAGEGADLMTGLGVELGARPGRARPRGDRWRGRGAGARARRRAPARRAGAAPSCWTRSWPRRSSGSSARCCRPTPSSAAARCSPTRRATRSPTPRSSLTDDATDPEGPASAPFDGEGSAEPAHAADRRRQAAHASCSTCAPPGAPGAPRRPTPAAARTARPPSVGTTNLVLEPGERDLDGLFRAAGEGLFVTDVAGLHSGVNPVSGTFSVGASGRLIEGGEPGAPVRELTIAATSSRCSRPCAKWAPERAGCRSAAASRRLRCWSERCPFRVPESPE